MNRLICYLMNNFKGQKNYHRTCLKTDTAGFGESADPAKYGYSLKE